MDVLQRILDLRRRKGWTEWKLAEQSGIKQSTISTWYSKRQLPKIPTLEKICDTFGITLSQFFADEDELVDLTHEQRQLLESWNALTPRQRAIMLELIREIPGNQ